MRRTPIGIILAVLIVGAISLFAGITSSDSVPVASSVPGIDIVDNGLQALSPDTAAAWESSQTAEAVCKPNQYGYVAVNGTFNNNEPNGVKHKPPNWNYMKVVMKTPFGDSEPIIVPTGEDNSRTFMVRTQLKSSNGDFTVTFDRYWDNPQRSGKPDPTGPIWVSGVECKTKPKPKITAKVNKVMPKRTYPGRDFVMKVTVRNTSPVPAKFALIDRLPRNRAGKLYMVGYTKAGRLGAHTLGRQVILKPGGVYTQRWRFRVTPVAMLLHYTNCVIVRQVGNSTVLDRDCDWSFDPPEPRS